MEEGSVDSSPSIRPAWISRSVQEAATGAYRDTAEIVFAGPGLTVYRGAESHVVLPHTGKALLFLDYRNRDSDVKKGLLASEVRFHYDLQNKDYWGDIAEMTFEPKGAKFLLTHRLVREEYRHRGIGTMLLKEAESWIGALAQHTGSDLTIEIGAAQTGVIRWAMENGYEVNAYDSALLQAVIEHPEQFDTQDFHGQDNITREGYLFPKNDKRERSENSAIRFTFRKVMPGKSAE